MSAKDCYTARGVDGWNRGRIQPTRGRSTTTARGTTTGGSTDGLGVKCVSRGGRRGVAARAMAEDGKTLENKMMNSVSRSKLDDAATLYSDGRDERMKKTMLYTEEETNGF